MAESLLFGLAELVITKFASDAVKEASLALGVKKDLNEIINTVSFIKAVLLDAEQKQHQNNGIREWLKQIKHIFYDAEDVIDDFECERLRKQIASGSNRKKVRLFLSSSSNPVVYRVRMAHHIKDIRERFDKVAENRGKFGLQSCDSGNSVVQRPETHSGFNKSDVIGRVSDKEKVVNLLLGKDDDKSLSVIAIAGMGGMGKTALAKAVFNDKRVVKSFPVKMWVSVSYDFELKNLVVNIIDATPIQKDHETIKNCNIEQQQNHLKKALSRKKFLLVLDDVWNEDRGKWEALRDILRQEHARGSKVLVTSRSNTVANVMDASSSCILQGLSLEDSLSVFVKCAFKGEERKYPEQMVLAKEIVLKCGGVPLAIRTLGSSLSSKVDQIQEWKIVRDNEIWTQGDEDFWRIIKLSYDRLPSYLKRCFACFSLFEKDFHFNSCHTIVLWEALGLLPHKGEKLKDGNQCLHELWSRSFLQDFVDHGGVYKFKLHVLVHDLALYVSRDHEFQLWSSRSENMSENALHLSFDKNYMFRQTPLPLGLRTILFPIGVNDEAFLNTSVSRCKYLRVLQINNSGYKRLPHFIGKLKHLRYLNLKDNEELESLPNSVCKLQNLINLNLSGCTKLQKLPNGIGNLISLQQLHITTRESKLPDKEIAKLTSLEILTLVSCDNLESLFEGIELPSLKYLAICSCGSLRSLHGLPKLEYLKIEGCPRLYKRYQPNVGKDWPKISHIKQVIIVPPEELES
ncbi:hypothetical protein TSUD_33440 [Trifolium subterraneum]|uniref:Uncharacterized protein n=1 Tax=Trifolium subterraneum TaxID=3900 RepID=A0A2Z6LUU4_TRISU|nr:hypothetical protein TSUD_33440 [Trifolium subterraneum]